MSRSESHSGSGWPGTGIIGCLNSRSESSDAETVAGPGPGMIIIGFPATVRLGRLPVSRMHWQGHGSASEETPPGRGTRTVTAGRARASLSTVTVTE